MPPQFTVRQNRVTSTTETWKRWAEEREVDEWIQHCAAVLDQGWNDAYVLSRKYQQTWIFDACSEPPSLALHGRMNSPRASTVTSAWNGTKLVNSFSGIHRPSW
jgi:hypothetical protein